MRHSGRAAGIVAEGLAGGILRLMRHRGELVSIGIEAASSKAPGRGKRIAQTVMNIRDHLRTTGGALKHWATGQLQDSLAVGVLWLIGLSILRVPLAPLWAAMAAVLQIVPHFGPVLSLLGPFIAATIKWVDWEHPVGVLALYAVIVVIDGLLLQPYIMRRTARVPIWASILAPIVLGIIWPFWGVLVAPPLLAVVYAYRSRGKGSGKQLPRDGG
jgi:predicted PurR-regulated permease PerM